MIRSAFLTTYLDSIGWTFIFRTNRSPHAHFCRRLNEDVQGLEFQSDMEPPDTPPIDASFADLAPLDDDALRRRESVDGGFVLRPPVRDNEINAISAKVRRAIDEAMRCFEEDGAEVYRGRYLAPLDAADRDDAGDGRLEDESREAALVQGSPRKYQVALFERCKVSNAIVHLGTGQGKTLVALLCMQHFAEVPHDEEGKIGGSSDSSGDANPEGYGKQRQIWFLVPSVALAVQHTVTIKANLGPLLTVATACHTATTSPKARETLSKAQIVVATHGSAKDLMDHYGDYFNLERVNLLILDECHYATGKHTYAQIMKTHYHTLPASKRPRIVGLTASPLINVKRTTCSPEQLQRQMSELEDILDAKVVCFTDLGKPSEECLKQIERDVDERAMNYSSMIDSFRPFPSHDTVRGLHKTRIKELNQLQNLYAELGPRATGEYCDALAKELSRSQFEGETVQQFERMVSHLKGLSSFCSRQCRGADSSSTGRSDKLILLEDLLKSLLERTHEAPSGGVGVVFVERRITAVALHAYLKKRQSEEESGCQQIRCDCLVRQSHQVFKYLHFVHKIGNNGSSLPSAQTERAVREAEADWLHQTKQIRSVLDGLRKRHINLLIATSVVEEGVDVTACSFVIVFDGIKTTKGYVQMKGRARQKSAKFYCFHDVNPTMPPPVVSLGDAQTLERTVKLFLERREENAAMSDESRSSLKVSCEPANPSQGEVAALRTGEYRTLLARVDQQSSKSLLNRYFLSIPMENQSRSSRERMKMQMPIYEETRLILPAHLPPALRICRLPEPYISFKSKKKRQELLALMAVVRLRVLGLLTDRLLPLKRDDMLRTVLPKVLPSLPPPPLSQLTCPPAPTDGEGIMPVNLYRLLQTGDVFDEHDTALNGRGRHLGLLVRSQLPSVLPSFSFEHGELGLVMCHIEKASKLHITPLVWNKCAGFYANLVNSRWKRRTGRKYFRYDESSENASSVPPYVVVPLTEHGEVDWLRMDEVKAESRREEKDRVAAVKTFGEAKGDPRLWVPRYDPNVTYIAYSSSSLTCDAPFPNCEYENYKDYFQRKRSWNVEPSCRLFVVQHSWTLPRTVRCCDDVFSCHESKTKKRKNRECDTDAWNLQNGEVAPCSRLRPAYLAQDACMEAPLADASLLLHCVLLPQILYLLDRHLTASALVSHFLHNERFSTLGKRLNQIELKDTIEVLTATSCSLGISYDRLEWIGDAVLKLIHVDALLHSPDLEKWISCLHEGDLSSLRSAMGCNERLKEAAVSSGIDRFILTVPLARGIWIPNGLQAQLRNGERPSEDDLVAESEILAPSLKVSADVIEALLGLLYLVHGYEAAAEAAEVLLVTIPRRRQEQTTVHANCTVPKPTFRVAGKFLGITSFHRPDLLKEALTHASCIQTDVPSYQKLEWIGDAVVCLAAREWAYKKYTNMPVASLVVLETTVVCNETLSYLGWRKGLQLLIRHADASLPGRIESFALGIRPDELGLWGTDAPKVLADVVEALLGAVHVDGGFHRGQKSALYVLEPVLEALSAKVTVDDSGIAKARAGTMMQPKQVLSQTANFLRVRVTNEHDFAARFPSQVWEQQGWKQASQDGDNAVCHISCCGINVLAIAEPSSTVARNRACAVISEVLARNPDLLRKMQTISTELADKK